MNTQLVVVIAVLTLVLAVPTAAITLEDDTASPISFDASSSYAEIEGGELELDVDRLNDRAETSVDEVFTITVSDDAVEAIWLENDIDGVTFYEGGNRSAEIDESNPVILDSGDTVSVGVEIDTHVASDASETFTIVAEYEADESVDGDQDRSSSIELESVEHSATELAVNESLVTTATYENTGNATGFHVAELVVDGVTVDRQEIHVHPGESETVRFERSMKGTGTFAVGVDDHPPEIVTVVPPDEPTADIAVTDATLENETIRVGESTTVTATVENQGDAAGERSLELAVGGSVVDTESVALKPGGNTTVEFERAFDEPGTYEVGVSGVEAGSLTVTEREPISVADRELSSPTTAALAPPTALGLLFLLTAVNGRRKV